MSTVGDILKLQSFAVTTLIKTGGFMTDIGERFGKRMKELIIRSFVTLCLSEEEFQECTRDTLPSIDEMCDSLNELNQETPLPQFAQCSYYCAVAVLLTMDGDSEGALLAQLGRADAMMNVGVISF